jgi:hypothetical protein
MAPIATADGITSHITEPVPANSADEVNTALKHAAPEHGQGSGTTTTSPGVTKHLHYPRSNVSLVDRFVDEPRKIKVVIIGGGLAGILGGCLLPQKVPDIELVIYEKNHEFVSLIGPLVLLSPTQFPPCACGAF